MHPKSRSRAAILKENADLQLRLAEAEEMLRAIQTGEVDALVIQTSSGPQVYTPQGQDAEANRVRGEMLAQVSDAVIALDLAERITYLNAAAEQLYGVVMSEALGRMWWEIFEVRWPHPDDEAVARAVLRERGEWRGENVLVTRDGRVLSVESGVSMLSQQQRTGWWHPRRDPRRDRAQAA